MWTCKFKVFDEDLITSKLVRKHKIQMQYYPINNYEKNGRHFFVSTGVFDTGETSVRAFCADLRKRKAARTGRRLDLLERSGNHFVIITSLSVSEEQRLVVSAAYNPQIIHYRPVIWHPDGWEEWHVACIEREPLANLIRVARGIYQLKLQNITRQRITNIGFMQVLSNLTEKQQRAFDLALEQGYYAIPRKIGLVKLAAMSHLALSTYQAHLRKAEGKLLAPLVKTR
jgi:predicted DNA binding protein